MDTDERRQLQNELRKLSKNLDYLADPQRREKVNALRWQLYPLNFTKDGNFSFPYQTRQEEIETKNPTPRISKERGKRGEMM